MEDTISRKMAIDALAKNMPSLTTPDGCGEFNHDIQVTDEAYVDCMQIIHELPSAQPDSKESSSTHKALDTISRKAAIEVIEDELDKIDHVPRWVFDKLTNRLRELPSTQSEIIRCKDCKYGDTFHEIHDPEMPMMCIGHNYGWTYPDDFCRYAERKTDERTN